MPRRGQLACLGSDLNSNSNRHRNISAARKLNRVRDGTERAECSSSPIDRACGPLYSLIYRSINRSTFGADRIINIIYIFPQTVWLCLLHYNSYKPGLICNISILFFGPKHSPIARSKPFTSISNLYFSFSAALESTNMASSTMAKVKANVVILSEPVS